jgi:hypothetical protein
MNTLLIAVLVLSGSPLEGTEAGGNALAVSAKPQAAKVRSGSELRDAVHQAIGRWGRPGEKDLRAAARQLMPLYVELQHDKELSPSVREELRGKVRLRLLDIAAQLKARPVGSVAVPTDRGQPLAQRGLNLPAGRNGPDQDDNNADLADLIQQVISPQTWEANGGRGTIHYWRPGHAMVVRQTQDVHDEIGEVLLQLRKAGQ